MNNWEEKPLSDVAELVKSSWKVGDEKLPYIALEHIVENGLRINGIGNSDVVGSNKYRFDENTFLFGKLRPYFRKVYRPDFDGICSTDIWVVKPKADNDKDFLFYFFANQEFVDISYSSASGTRMPRADWKFMKNTEWDFPHLPEQKAIAEVLSSLDDKIDLLHRQNKTLEAMAETLFRQWFVEEAEESWDDFTLGEIIEIKGGYSYKGKFIGSGDSLLLGMGCVSNNERFLISGARNYSGDFPKKHLVNPGDIVLATRQQSENMPILGFPALVPEELAGKEIIVGTNLYRVYNKSELSNTLLFQLFRSCSYKTHIKASSKGTTVRMITKDAVESFNFQMPHKSNLLKIENSLSQINSKLRINFTQLNTLTNLRDTLLPKLMSGEVRVKMN